MPRKRKHASDSDSESETDSRTTGVVTKKSLHKAIDLIFEEDGKSKCKRVDVGGPKALRKCQMPGLRAHGLCSTANISCPESCTTKMLEAMRLCLLRHQLQSAAELLELLLQSASKPLLPVIWKIAVVLFSSSQISNEQTLDDFLQLCATQRSQQDKQRFMQRLTALPDTLDSKRATQHSTYTDDVDDPGFIVVSDDEDHLSIEP